MKILILDVYPDVPYRISKDQNGGYGTANNYGDGLICSMLKKFVARGVDWPPLHALYTAGVLRNQGHDVSYSRYVPNEPLFDLVIVPSSIVAHETELQAIQLVVKISIPVIAIGPFATHFAQPYIQAGARVVMGEPEMFFATTQVDTTFCKQMHQKLTVETSLDLDELPYPAWDLILKEQKMFHGFLSGSSPTLPINATRGCPYSCSHYCTYPLQQGKKVRKRAPSEVVKEMIYWQDNYGIVNFIFRDPVFSIDTKHAEELCEHIINTNRKFTFAIEAHLKNVNANLAEKLKNAGLELLYVGIESSEKDVLQAAKRYTESIDLQRQKIKMLEKFGIKVKGMYILGLPTDNISTCLNTIKYAISLNTAYAQFNVFTPYPGTPIFQEYQDKIIVKRMEHFTQYHFVFQHPSIDADQIRVILNKAYRKYYTNLGWIVKNVKNIIKVIFAIKLSGPNNFFNS